jgi:hypothetical protein
MCVSAPQNSNAFPYINVACNAYTWSYIYIYIYIYIVIEELMLNILDIKIENEEVVEVGEVVII